MKFTGAKGSFIPPPNLAHPIRCPPSPFPPPWATYRIGRGETGVLTYEPYKSALLPLWHFKTPAIARTSSAALWDAFLNYEREDDFVGMDMCRKFIQMGMTRAKRYANHKDGRKYGADGNVIEFGEAEDWEGRKEMEEASMIFREVWERARNHEGYQMKKKEFLKEQKEWGKDQTRKEAPEGKGKKRKRKEEDEEKQIPPRQSNRICKPLGRPHEVYRG